MPLAEGIVDSVSNVNLKNNGEMPVHYANIILGDEIDNRRNMMAIREKSIQRGLERADTIQQDELGLAGLASNNNLVATMAQILTKLAQTTNPQTGA